MPAGFARYLHVSDRLHASASPSNNKTSPYTRSSATMADPTEPNSTDSGPSNSASQPTNTTSEASSSSTTTQCAQCGKSPSSLKQCLKCHSVSYCDKDCQKAHFKTHKKVCASLAQEYVKANEPKMASRSTQSTKDARDKGLQKWQVSEDDEIGNEG
jgi:hypothetical protein